MKRTYSKPEINFDSFGLQASFAAGCSIDTNHGTGECAAIIAGMPMFTDAIQNCKFHAQDGMNGICYYVPTAEQSVFSS